ncbi:MAG: thioesterase family protein [Desulforegulaceae bacterium]|nr:thioesterase family protein [Desulforegulaceae bacterium]
MTEKQSLHPFDQAISLTKKEDKYIGETSALYENMVGPYGGIIAAVLLNSVMIHPQRLGDPLALTVNYAAPVKNGKFEIKPLPVRTNRSTQHWYLTLSQDDGIAATATIVTANRRETWSSQEKTMPEVPDVNEIDSFSIKGLPSWFNQYDVRPIRGSMPPFLEIKGEEPFKASNITQWIRDNPKRKMDFLSLASFADSPVPGVYVRRNNFVPTGTVSFTVYFHSTIEELNDKEDGFVLVDVESSRIHNNYCDQSGEIWSEDKVLLATTSQILYFRE